MKTLLKVWLILTLVIILGASIKLLDTYVSLKYEVYEPNAMNLMNAALLDKEKYLKSTIFWLWTLIAYGTTNLLIVVRLLSRG
jgi:hypothetical protein